MSSPQYLYDAALAQSIPIVSKYYNEHYQYYRMNEHRHPAFEIMYVKEGKCRVPCVNPETHLREEFTIKEGQYIYIYSNIAHNLFIDRDAACRILNIEIELHPKCGHFSLESLPDAASFRKFLDAAPMYALICDDGSMYGMLTLLQEKSQEIREFDRDASDISLDTALTAALLLLKLASQAQAEPPSYNFAEEYVRHAKKYIQEHYDSGDELTISKIAAEVNLSSAYLQRLFRAETGDTISAYVNQLRLRKAKHLLEKTDLSLVDVAVNTGLNSRQRLTQLFHTMQGVSPGKYRTNSRNRKFEQNQ